MDIKLKEVSTAALAYLGDSVIELCVRKMLVESGFSSSKRLNAKALLYVTAKAQAQAVEKILPLLSEEEDAVYHRGRNISHANVPKSASFAEYRMATGFEALFGYLHLAGRNDRIDELFKIAYSDGNEINGGNENE